MNKQFYIVKHLPNLDLIVISFSSTPRRDLLSARSWRRPSVIFWHVFCASCDCDSRCHALGKRRYEEWSNLVKQPTSGIHLRMTLISCFNSCTSSVRTLSPGSSNSKNHSENNGGMRRRVLVKVTKHTNRNSNYQYLLMRNGSRYCEGWMMVREVDDMESEMEEVIRESTFNTSIKSAVNDWGMK